MPMFDELCDRYFVQDALRREQVPMKDGDKHYDDHMGFPAAPGYRWEYDSELRARATAMLK